MSSIVLLFLYINTLYLTCCDASNASISELSSTDTSLTGNEGITETHHATCKIATEEIVASARATVTRVLTGACTAKMIDEKFQALEKTLAKELEQIKALLGSILEKRNDPARVVKMFDDRREDKSGILSPRRPEIMNFNNTIQRISSVNGTSSVFFYYWQIKDFDEKLDNWKTARSERSSTLHVGQNGYAMYVKITPRYFPDGTVFIGVGLTRGQRDSIKKWPFPHKIRLEILDHSSGRPLQDRRSRIWDPSTLCSEYFWGRPKLTGEPDNPECVGLSVPRQVLFSKLPSSIDSPARSTRYLWDGCITIKLTVYL